MTGALTRGVLSTALAGAAVGFWVAGESSMATQAMPNTKAAMQVAQVSDFAGFEAVDSDVAGRVPAKPSRQLAEQAPAEAGELAGVRVASLGSLERSELAGKQFAQAEAGGAAAGGSGGGSAAGAGAGGAAGGTAAAGSGAAAGGAAGGGLFGMGTAGTVAVVGGASAAAIGGGVAAANDDDDDDDKETSPAF